MYRHNHHANFLKYTLHFVSQNLVITRAFKLFFFYLSGLIIIRVYLIVLSIYTDRVHTLFHQFSLFVYLNSLIIVRVYLIILPMYTNRVHTLFRKFSRFCKTIVKCIFIRYSCLCSCNIYVEFKIISPNEPL